MTACGHHPTDLSATDLSASDLSASDLSVTDLSVWDDKMCFIKNESKWDAHDYGRNVKFVNTLLKVVHAVKEKKDR